jgi:phosphoenolpyruvate carboxykinase (ATP)
VVGTDDSVDLDQVNALIFITRRDDIIPALARLSRAQAAAFFMLGESIETSAGDPTKAGQAKREVGTNPFIIGQEADEGNRLLALLEKHPDLKCYLLNTGRVGKSDKGDGAKLTIAHSTGLLREIARGSLSYERDPFWGYDVAVSGTDLDLANVDPRRFYSADDLSHRNRALRDERVSWLQQFPGLDQRILSTIDKAGL